MKVKIENLPVYLDVLASMVIFSFAKNNISNKDNKLFWDSCFTRLTKQDYKEEEIKTTIDSIRAPTEFLRAHFRDIPAETFK